MTSRRWRLRISRYGEPFRPSTPDEDALLGTVPDKQLMWRFNRTVEAIAACRQKLEIPPCRPQAWRPEEDNLLGTGPDEQLARQLRRTKIAVRARRCELGIPNHGRRRQLWSAEQDQLLATMFLPRMLQYSRQVARGDCTSTTLHAVAILKP